MVTTLVLVRHAKAAAEGRTDAERPLADRGRVDAPAIGRWLADQGVVPDLVVVSPARRARQTWELAAGALGTLAPAVDERVYRNTLDDLLDVVRATPDVVETLVLVGHNPSIEVLAAALDDGAGPLDARLALAEKYPTSGVAVLDVHGPWAGIARGSATLAAFGVPRA